MTIGGFHQQFQDLQRVIGQSLTKNETLILGEIIDAL